MISKIKTKLKVPNRKFKKVFKTKLRVSPYEKKQDYIDKITLINIFDNAIKENPEVTLEEILEIIKTTF